MGTVGIIVVYAVILGGMWFLLMRPQKKEQKRIQAMLADMEIGDTALTTSGFYGVIIDITDDDVIVEFGNNKNCRIPMQKVQSLRLRSRVQNKMQIKTRGSDSFWSFILHKMCPKNTIFNKNTECPLFFYPKYLKQ